jgi:two-component system, response regulator PdtaR
LRNLRVLVADDESIIRMDLKEMLSELGHEVVGDAATGREAYQMCLALRPDLVFLDIKMPDLDGLEVLRLLNEQCPTPVIMVTAFSEASMVEKAVELGAKAYVVKPFKAANVLPAIELALAHFEELGELRRENADLKEAIESSKRVNKAKLALAEHEGLSESEAFRRMQKMSMDRNKKMREVADAVLLLYGGS